MTEQEIDAMEAGREMDALVHRHVFNFKAPPYTAWHYSTDIGAAWLVVEKMRELRLSRQFVTAWGQDVVWHWAFLTEAAFCLHICRAALKVTLNCHKITTNEANEPTEKTG